MLSVRAAIKNFNQQFEFMPRWVNQRSVKKFKKFVVCGMGGSHLAADLIKIYKPKLDLIIHSDYNLPDLEPINWQNRLVVVSSYSGNTEEAISAFWSALKRKLPVAVITKGGTLLNLAQKKELPYIQLPDIGLEPRLALGFSLKAMLKVFGLAAALKETTALSRWLKPLTQEEAGRQLAQRLQNLIPIIYASRRNWSVALNWKVKFNETAKIPAFVNFFPELNHNEMAGFETSPALSRPFYFIFLTDKDDLVKIKKRMTVLSEMYRQRRRQLEILPLRGQNVWQKIFSSLILADWTAYYLAIARKVEPGQTPMIEKFKKLIADI